MAKMIEKLADCNAYAMMQECPRRTKLKDLVLLLGAPGVGKGSKSDQMCRLDREVRQSHRTIIGRVPVSGLVEWHKKATPRSEIGKRFIALEQHTGNIPAQGNLYPDNLVLEVIADGVKQRATEERNIIMIDAPRNAVQVEQIISWGLPVKAIVFDQSLVRSCIRVFMRTLQGNSRIDDKWVEQRFEKHAQAAQGMIDVLNEHSITTLHCHTEQPIKTQLLTMAEFLGYDRQALLTMRSCLKNPTHPVAMEIREMEATESLAEEAYTRNQQKQSKKGRRVQTEPVKPAQAHAYA